MAVKRGDSQKHTQSVQRSAPPPGPESQQLFENHSGFTIKVKIYFFILIDRKFFSGKTKHFSTFWSFSYCSWLLRPKNVLSIDLQESAPRKIVFSIDLQESAPRRNVLRCEQETLTIDTYDRHLRWTLAIDTCNRHLQ